MSEAGFYKLDTVDRAVIYGSTKVTGPGFILSSSDRLPIAGWYWFETQAEAEKTLLPESGLSVQETENANVLRLRANNALADLRLISNSTGALSALQLSNAVRKLAEVSIIIIRLLLRKLEDQN